MDFINGEFGEVVSCTTIGHQSAILANYNQPTNFTTSDILEKSKLFIVVYIVLGLYLGINGESNKVCSNPTTTIHSLPLHFSCIFVVWGINTATLKCVLLRIWL